MNKLVIYSIIKQRAEGNNFSSIRRFDTPALNARLAELEKLQLTVGDKIEIKFSKEFCEEYFKKYSLPISYELSYPAIITNYFFLNKEKINVIGSSLRYRVNYDTWYLQHITVINPDSKKYTITKTK